MKNNFSCQHKEPVFSFVPKLHHGFFRFRLLNLQRKGWRSLYSSRIVGVVGCVVTAAAMETQIQPSDRCWHVKWGNFRHIDFLANGLLCSFSWQFECSIEKSRCFFIITRFFCTNTRFRGFIFLWAYSCSRLSAQFALLSKIF